MSKKNISDIEIRITPISNQENAFQFHTENLNDYLLPRANKRFLSMIQDREVFEAFEHTSKKIVGICYITTDF